MAMIEPDSRSFYVPNLLNRAADPQMIGRLRSYAQQHIPPSARRSAVKAEAGISYRNRIRTQRLPDVDSWLEAHRQ
jgi:aminopeptidase N